MIFLITGLQARTLIPPIQTTVWRNSLAAAIVCAVVIVARFVWMYPATYIPRWLIPAFRRRDLYPPWQFPFALASTGIRGIVSLAAALAIPFTGGRQPFPDRDLILILDLRRHSGDAGRRRLDAARWSARSVLPMPDDASGRPSGKRS